MTAFILAHRDLIVFACGACVFAAVETIGRVLENHFAARKAIKRRLGWWKR